MKQASIGVLVAGSWGTALASVLANNRHHVKLWGRNPEHMMMLADERRNETYLPGMLLPDSLQFTSDLKSAVEDQDMIVIAARSVDMRELTAKIKPLLNERTIVVHATKGFEQDSHKRMSEVIQDELDYSDEQARRLAVISGPSHAEEVIRKYPTTLVAAAQDHGCAVVIQELFSNSHFRVYTNPDVIGVEVAGALKNIIALGAGLSDGLGFGDNAKAALITRGMAEMTRLGTKMGAQPKTFSGLAGVGDLVVTCTSRHSRNWRAGYQLGQGKRLEDVLTSSDMVIEGIHTTRAAWALAQKLDVIMPITEELYAVLFESKPPRDAVEDLMSRSTKQELSEWT